MSTSGGIDWGRISAIVGIVASVGGVAGVMFSPDTQRCVGLRGPDRGHPLRALSHCTDDRSTAAAIAASAEATASAGDAVPDAGDPRRMAGTRWVFWSGGQKAYVTFNADGTLTFSDPLYGADGVWSLAGSRGVAFHTDSYEFGGTIGRGVPDSFSVAYRPLPHGDRADPEQLTTFTRVAGDG